MLQSNHIFLCGKSFIPFSSFWRKYSFICGLTVALLAFCNPWEDANPNIQSNSNRTTLMLASLLGETDVVSLLLSAGRYPHKLKILCALYHPYRLFNFWVISKSILLPNSPVDPNFVTKYFLLFDSSFILIFPGKVVADWVCFWFVYCTSWRCQGEYSGR